MKSLGSAFRLVGLTMGLALGAGRAAAEVAPQTVNAGAGMMSLSTFSAAYKPTSKTMAVMSAGIDGRITPRFSVMLRTTSSTDETFSGASFGVTYNFSAHKTETTDGSDGLTQIRTTVVPRWTTRVGAGIGRWQYSQTLELTDQSRATSLRNVPVKAAVYGTQMRASLSRSFGETWTADGEYNFIYANASGFSLILHTVSVGPSYWF